MREGADKDRGKRNGGWFKMVVGRKVGGIGKSYLIACQFTIR